MITPDGIEILNAARRILERVDSDAMREAWAATGHDAASLGRMAETAKGAEEALFSFLNVAHNYGGVEMTYEQLHGCPEAVEVDA